MSPAARMLATTRLLGLVNPRSVRFLLYRAIGVGIARMAADNKLRGDRRAVSR